MKIIVACFLRLDELPPAVTFLKSLSNQYSNIVYYGIDDETETYNKLFNHRVHFKKVASPFIENVTNFKERLFNSYTWRINKLRFYQAAKKICADYEDGDIVWILHEYTLFRLGREIEQVPYNITMYEMSGYLFRDDDRSKARAARVTRAEKIVVPEYCRAAIVKACLNLKKQPYIIPNKPYEFNEEETRLADNPILSVVNKARAEGKQIVLYSGIFLRERKLDTIIQAVLRNPDKFVMVLIGRTSKYLEELLATYADVQYLGFVNPPQHLSMIQYADIGILTYVSDSRSINPVFCAPNKSWEYSKFGIPMLCNDIPGLRYSVEYNGIGYCCDIDDVDDIERKLLKIRENHNVLSQKAIEYYNSIDVDALIHNVLQD